MASVSRVELIRLTPMRPACSAVSREPAPHQMRRSSPGECGSTASFRPGPYCSGSAVARASPRTARRKRSNFARARSAPRGSFDPVYPKVSQPRRAGSGDPRDTPRATRPSESRSRAAASSARCSGFSYDERMERVDMLRALGKQLENEALRHEDEARRITGRVR